MGRERITVG